MIASEKKEEVSDEPKVAAPGGSSTDQFTYANIDAVKTQHLHMDLAVDFDTQTIDGTVEHTFKFEKPTDQVVLDAQGMEISGASFDFEGKAYDLKFELGADRDGFGAPLTIQLPQKVEAGKELKLKVHYKTNQDAVAFSWLSPEQTLGKK